MEKEQKIIDLLIGETEKSGREICEKESLLFRVVREDSERYMITMDFRIDRINAELDNGIITVCYLE
jgi:hypothetical protein